MATRKTSTTGDDTRFVARSPLDEAIRAGDFDRTVASVAAIEPSARHRERGRLFELQKMISTARYAVDNRDFGPWGEKSTHDQTRAFSAALFLCGTAKDTVEAFLSAEDAIALGRRFQPRALDGLVEETLRISPRRIHFVQQLIAAQLAERPGSDEYIVGLIALPYSLRSKHGLADELAADPGVYPSLLRMFEIEGTSEFSLASVEKYTHQDAHSWTSTFLKLIDDGVFTRAQLLAKTLDALERDWPQHRSGWFSRFHDALAPGVAEMKPHEARYLALCQSLIPPTVTLALQALLTLHAAGALAADALLAALAPVMSSATKGHIDAALKLLDAFVARDKAMAHEAASITIPALAHDSADLQKKVLARLAKWGVTDGEPLQGYAAGIAATNRAAFDKIAGSRIAPVVKRLQPATTPKPAISAPIDPLDESRRLPPIVELHDLVDRIAYVFENDDDTDETERVLEAIVRHGPLGPSNRTLFAPLVKRAPKLRKSLPEGVARLVTFVATGERTPRGHEEPMVQWQERIDGLINLAAQAKGVAPLSAATHRRGFIDPAVFIERVRAHQTLSVESTMHEQVLGLLRLACPATPDVLEQARGLHDTPPTRALRYALGDDTIAPGKERVLFIAASRARYGRADDDRLFRTYGDIGPDGSRGAQFKWSVTTRHSESGEYTFHDVSVKTASVPVATSPDCLTIIRHARGDDQWFWPNLRVSEASMFRYFATLWPSQLESFFADGARALGNNLDWWEAEWQNKAFLELLLDPTVQLDANMPMANLTLALGLGGKEPGQTALAVDALASAHRDGRIDMEAFGAMLRDLLATPLPKAARYRKSLQDATRLDAAMPAFIFDLLCLSLQGDALATRNDGATLLELLLELALIERRKLPEATRSALAARTFGGKSKALQKQLLAL